MVYGVKTCIFPRIKMIKRLRMAIIKFSDKSFVNRKEGLLAYGEKHCTVCGSIEQVRDYRLLDWTD